MSRACMYCLLPGGKGVSFAKGNIFETDEEFFEHIEMEHDIPVRREGETAEEAQIRHSKKNPRAGGPDCQCPGCLQQGAALELLTNLREEATKGE